MPKKLVALKDIRYNGSMDPEEQVDAEEAIAAHLFDQLVEVDEDVAQELGREILKLVLYRFRPDLVAK